jgi:hypothetical protein
MTVRFGDLYRVSSLDASNLQPFRGFQIALGSSPVGDEYVVDTAILAEKAGQPETLATHFLTAWCAFWGFGCEEVLSKPVKEEVSKDTMAYSALPNANNIFTCSKKYEKSRNHLFEIDTTNEIFKPYDKKLEAFLLSVESAEGALNNRATVVKLHAPKGGSNILLRQAGHIYYIPGKVELHTNTAAPQDSVAYTIKTPMHLTWGNDLTPENLPMGKDFKQTDWIKLR